MKYTKVVMEFNENGALDVVYTYGASRLKKGRFTREYLLKNKNIFTKKNNYKSSTEHCFLKINLKKVKKDYYFGRTPYNNPFFTAWKKMITNTIHVLPFAS